MAKRVVFTFDDKSLDALEEVKNKGDFPSLGTAVRESIQLSEVLHEQAEQGFSEVVVRNPKTKAEKVILVPSLRKKPTGA